MALLNEYSTIEEKKNFFTNGDIKVIINIEGIFEKLDYFESLGEWIFRGSPEAKYKLYNTAQRTFIYSELFLQALKKDYNSLYDQWIEQFIDDCKKWNSGTVVNLLLSSKIREDNSLAYLSYMQHYGVPTPLLDFTRNPYIALFFAIDAISCLPSNNEIDNYFSIYYTNMYNSAFQGWNYVFKKNITDLKRGVISYHDISKNKLQLLLPDNEIYKLFNNSNIINQQGLFFYNNNPFKPFEESYLEFIKNVKEMQGQKKYEVNPLEEEFAYCINIHKSLIPYINNKLESKGITREFIYPDPYKIKEYAMQNSFAKTIQ